MKRTVWIVAVWIVATLAGCNLSGSEPAERQIVSGWWKENLSDEYAFTKFVNVAPAEKGRHRVDVYLKAPRDAACYESSTLALRHEEAEESRRTSHYMTTRSPRGRRDTLAIEAERSTMRWRIASRGGVGWSEYDRLEQKPDSLVVCA